MAASCPSCAHVPVLVNDKRQKLSKRRDKVALEDYRDEGYLAEAMRNYLMLLGWAPKGDDEIVPWSVIEEQFRLDDVVPSPAFFDVKKLTAFNGEYIRGLTAGRVRRGEPSRGWPSSRLRRSRSSRRMAPLVQERVKVLSRGARPTSTSSTRCPTCRTTSPRPPRTPGPPKCSMT